MRRFIDSTYCHRICRQRRRRNLRALALFGPIEFLHDRARAAGDDGAGRRRTADQRGEDRAFGLVERVGCVTEKAKRRAADTDLLTAQWHQIQIRLDDLLLGPPALERNREAGVGVDPKLGKIAGALGKSIERLEYGRAGERAGVDLYIEPGDPADKAAAPNPAAN